MRSELRAQVLNTDGPSCAWAFCRSQGEEMAHIHGIGMGGRASADTLENACLLCRSHHDLLDGRSHHKLRYEMGELLRGYMRLKRGTT